MILLLLEIVVFLFFSHIHFFHALRETIQKRDNSNVYARMRPKSILSPMREISLGNRPHKFINGGHQTIERGDSDLYTSMI